MCVCVCVCSQKGTVMGKIQKEVNNYNCVQKYIHSGKMLRQERKRKNGGNSFYSKVSLVRYPQHSIPLIGRHLRTC